MSVVPPIEWLYAQGYLTAIKMTVQIRAVGECVLLLIRDDKITIFTGLRE